MISVLFLCVLAPVVLFGYLSLQRVEAKIQEESVRRMLSQSREVALGVNASLSLVDERAKFLASVIGTRNGPAGKEWMGKNKFILGASRIHGGARSESLYGKACPLPPQDGKALAHLASGKGLLYLDRGPDGTSRAFIARATPGRPPQREMVSAELNLEYIWNQILDSIPSLSEAVVLSPNGEMLFRTGMPPPGLVDRVMRKRDMLHLGSFEWSDGAESMIVSHAMVFLKPSFHSDSWTVAVIRPRSEVFAAADQFIRVLSLVIAVTVLVAGLFALVQVRRSVAPLVTLREGTRRISEGDFDSRIEIGSGDEFEELARSFNAMAEQIGKEFRSQAALGRTIQSILGETDRGRIVRALLDNVGSAIPSEYAGISLLETPGQAGAMTTCTRDGSPADRSGTGRTMMFLDANDAERLKSMETCAVVTPDGEFGNFLSRGPVPRPATGILAPILSHGELSGVLLLGYTSPRVAPPEVMVRLRQIADQAAVALSRARLVEELNENDLGTLQALSRAVDTNSSWTAGHSQRVTSLSMEIGWELGLAPQEIDSLLRGGLLHDIGKLGIPTSILDKPAALTEQEFDLIKRHPSSGADILRPIPTMGKVIPIVAQHHERYDGSGYPLGLKRDEISLHARILALADVVDAVSSNRPYRSGWPREKTLSYVDECSGVQFDPDVVKAFLRVAGRKKGGSLAGASWSPAAGYPLNPPSPHAAPSSGPPAAREASFSGYSEPYLLD